MLFLGFLHDMRYDSGFRNIDGKFTSHIVQKPKNKKTKKKKKRFLDRQHLI
jgi:hypothetical protein